MSIQSSMDKRTVVVIQWNAIQQRKPGIALGSNIDASHSHNVGESSHIYKEYILCYPNCIRFKYRQKLWIMLE